MITGLFWVILLLVGVMTLEDKMDRFSRNVGKELPLLCVIAKKSPAFFFVNACSEQMKNYFGNISFRNLTLKLHTQLYKNSVLDILADDQARGVSVNAVI